jgi:two-component system sensor histidine kinase SenX3
VTIVAVSLAVVAVIAIGTTFYLWNERRHASAAIDDVLKRVGQEQTKGMSRAQALTLGVDRVEGYLAKAERERAQLVGSLDAADFGVLATDDSGTVTFVNSAASKVIGARHGEAVAEARIGELLEKVIVSRAEETEDLDLYTPMRRVLRLRAAPLEYGVESMGAVVFIDDVTEEKRADVIRTDFISNVGHELKTPLAAFSVLAETIADTREPELLHKLTDRLSSEAARISHLVDDILDLSQVEAFASAPQAFVIGDVIQEAVASTQGAAEDGDVDLYVEPIPEDAFVSGDRRQLVSAVTNLVDNAIKYTAMKGAGGKVRVRAIVSEEWVETEIRDEGIGIPDAHIDRIFERFYRVDRARSRDTGGTGLGLAIVRHVALNHGGEVLVSSEEGSGSTFTLRLPPPGPATRSG